MGWVKHTKMSAQETTVDEIKVPHYIYIVSSPNTDQVIYGYSTLKLSRLRSQLNTI
jgi:hypothetical protein